MSSKRSSSDSSISSWVMSTEGSFPWTCKHTQKGFQNRAPFTCRT